MVTRDVVGSVEAVDQSDIVQAYQVTEMTTLTAEGWVIVGIVEIQAAFIVTYG